MKKLEANRHWFWILLLATVQAVAAQEKADDVHPLLPAYQRAAALQAYAEDKWVLNQNLYPRWIDETSFWYDRETADGTEYVRVDAKKGKKEPAFNHKSLAKALAKQAEQEVDAADLPISALVIDASSATFSAFGKSWEFKKGRLTELTEGAIDPAWRVSPDGKRAVFSRDHNLWLRDLESGKEKALTSDGEAFYAYGAVPNATGRPAQKPESVWSPDSRYLLTAQTDERKVKSLPVIDYAPADGSIRPRVVDYRQSLPGDEHVTRFRMAVIDTETGGQTRIHYPDLAAVRMKDTPLGGNRAWWSADSSAVYFVDILRGEKEARVVKADRDSGAARIVFTETTDTYLELGLNVYMPASIVPLPESNEFIWYSEKSGWAHLYLHDADTGKEKRALTSGDWRVRDVLGVDAENRQLFISVGARRPDVNPYYREIARVDLDSGDLTILSSGDDDRLVLSKGDFSLLLLTIFGMDPDLVSGVAPGGAYYVETRQRPDRPNTTVLMDAQGEEVMVVEQAALNTMPEGQPWPEPFSVTAADGSTDIRGVMYRPRDFDENKRYPIIDYIYGGPQVAVVPKAAYTGSSIGFDAAASLSELGFIVVTLDGRGTAERSRAFHETSHGQIHTASNLEDHVAGIRQLAERFPYMDIDRVGITGFSGGGYMAAHAMLKFPDFFKVGVSGAGNHDQRLFWHTWGERYQGLLEGDNYLEQANLTHAENLQGKLMFIHGMLDHGCHPGGLFQLTQALMNANKTFDLVLMPQARHELPGYAMVRSWDYFVRHLAGKEPPVGFSAKSSGDLTKEKVIAMQMAAQGGDAIDATEPMMAPHGKKALGKPVGVILETSAGKIHMNVYPEAAPKSAGSFLDHLDQGLFDGAAFYRVVRKDNDNGSPIIEVIQGGLTDPAGALPPVAHETTEQTGLLHTDGTVSLGRGDPGTGSGAAFFITIGDQPSLDFGGMRNPDGLGFASFGKVTSGMDVVRRIQQMDSTAPVEDDYAKGQFLSEPVIIGKAYRTTR
ncbi:MAG: DPP IV N-terminal domain-containing protein [Xanthomonadales bacterium]|nr:DPP IV N-terminal domain-containing protein [Xanthomonadales bacterium]